MRALWPVLLGAAWVTACRPVRQHPEELPPQVSLVGVEIRSFQGDQIAAAGRAARLTYERDTTDYVAYEAVMRFPSRETTAPRAPGGARSGMEVRAPEVRGNLAEKRALGMGGVVMRSGEGMVGKTDRARFDGATMSAAGEEPVEVTGPGYRLHAKDFTFRLRDEAYEFEGATTWLGEGQ